MYDLIVIGGGPAGYKAALKAASSGLSTVLFEKKSLGGVCLNEGCIPTKSLLYSAKMYDHALTSEAFGVSAEAVSFDYGKVLKRRDRVVRRLVGGVGAALKAAGVEVVAEEAVLKDAHHVEAGGKTYECSNLLLCTGSVPFVPPIPGAERALDSSAALALDRIPSSVAIIGGGVIGMEFASIYNSFGAEVDVIEATPGILGGLDREISSMLQACYEKKGVRFHLGCRVSGVRETSVSFSTPEGEQCSLEAESVLVCVGRRPRLEGLEALGLETGRGVKVDSHMRTSVEGVYAAGDITGVSMLAHTAIREGEIAVEDILHRRDPSRREQAMSYAAIPSVVYTNPEIACVGAGEDNMPEGAIVKKIPMLFSGRFAAENEKTDGICKLILSPDSRILGVHMLGNGASEIIHSCCLAVGMALSLDDFRSTVFPHPTVSEILKEF